MSKKIDWNVILPVVAGILLLWMAFEMNKKNKKIDDLEKEIDERNDLNREIKIKLKELIENHSEDFDTDVAMELNEVLALFNYKHDSKATLALCKIIENLLKKLYHKSEIISKIVKEKNRKRPAYDDYLEAAKRDKLITKEDYHLLSVVKEVRNKEAHELNVISSKEKMISALICGVGSVLTFCNELKKKGNLSTYGIAEK